MLPIASDTGISTTAYLEGHCFRSPASEAGVMINKQLAITPICVRCIRSQYYKSPRRAQLAEDLLDGPVERVGATDFYGGAYGGAGL